MHIDNDDLEQFENNKLNTQNMLSFLEHLDNCDFCLETLMQQEETKCVSAPAHLKENILTKASSPEFQIMQGASRASRKMQMFYFSLRTAAGVIAALFLLFTLSQVHFPSVGPGITSQTEHTAAAPDTRSRNYLYNISKSIGQNFSDNTKIINDYVSDFSNTIINGGK